MMNIKRKLLPSSFFLLGKQEKLSMHAIVSDAAATLTAAPSPVHAVVPHAMAKLMATLSLLHAVVLNAMARPTAAPSGDDGKLDSNNGSGDAAAIK
jgi:hypothetical protein